MNWMTIIWPMMAAMCLTLALMHLCIGFSESGRAPHWFFTLAAVTVAVISGFELTLLRTQDLETYQALLRVGSLPIGIMIISVAGFVRAYFRTGRKWIFWSGVGLNALCQMANLLAPEHGIRHAVALNQVETFGGVWFTMATIKNGPWNYLVVLSIILVVAYVVDASVALWRQGARRRAALVGGSIVLFLLLSRLQVSLVEKGVMPTPYFVSFFFFGVILAMSYELGSDILRATTLARKLRDSERRSDLAARAAAMGFWTWNVRRDELWASENARALFGVSADAKIDMEFFFGLVHPDHRADVRAAIERAVAGAAEYKIDYQVRLPDGRTRWIASQGRMDFDASQIPEQLSGVVVDITDRRHSELELRQLRGQLAHAGRVSVMGQLAASMAHELNQPLGAILSNAEAAELFLKQEPPALDELAGILTDIRKDDERAGEVIRRMRSLLRRQDMERRPLAVNPLVEDVFRLVSADAALRRIKVDLELSPNLPRVEGDRIHLQQVILNLLMNAMEAMGKHTSDQRRIMVRTGRTDDDRVEISVTDSGPGIEPAILPNLFDPFFTTKSNGMGMGLAICQQIVEAHSGKIHAANHPSGGAIFSVVLPAEASIH